MHHELQRREGMTWACQVGVSFRSSRYFITSMSANKPSFSGSSAFPVVVRSASRLRSAKSEGEPRALRAGVRKMPYFYNVHSVFILLQLLRPSSRLIYPAVHHELQFRVCRAWAFGAANTILCLSASTY